MPGFFSRDFPIAKSLHIPGRLENIFKKPRNSSRKGRRRMARLRARNDAREARASRRIARSRRVTRRHGFMPRAQPNNNNNSNNNNGNNNNGNNNNGNYNNGNYNNNTNGSGPTTPSSAERRAGWRKRREDEWQASQRERVKAEKRHSELAALRKFRMMLDSSMTKAQKLAATKEHAVNLGWKPPEWTEGWEWRE